MSCLSLEWYRFVLFNDMLLSISVCTLGLYTSSWEARGKKGLGESAVLWLYVHHDYGHAIIFAIQSSHLYVILAMSHFAQLIGSHIHFNQTLGLCYSSRLNFSKKLMWYILLHESLPIVKPSRTYEINHVTFFSQ